MTPEEIKTQAEQVGLIAKIKDYGSVHIYTMRSRVWPVLVIDDLCDDGMVAVYDPNPDLLGGFWRDHYSYLPAYSYGTGDGRCFNRLRRQARTL